ATRPARSCASRARSTSRTRRSCARCCRPRPRSATPRPSTSRRSWGSGWRRPTSRRRSARSSEMRSLLRLVSVVRLLGSALSCARGALPEKPSRPVRVETVHKEGATGGLRYSASIQPYAQVTLAFKVGGYVREVLQRAGADGRTRDLQQGDAVTKGTVLA